MFLLLSGLAAGLLIGGVGIGGVILVPLLSYLGGVDVHTAIAAAMFAYLISGAVGTLVYAKHRSIRWDMTLPLWLAAMPAALAGALTAGILPGWWLEFCIGLLTAVSGAHSLRQQADPGREGDARLPKSILAAGGAITGFLSALTGTGGPLVLIPILMWCHLPVLMAIGLAQAIQLPIAALATSGNLYTGSLDLFMGCLVAAGISFGTWGGSKLAHRLPKATLRRIVSSLLVIVGGLILAKLGYTFVQA